MAEIAVRGVERSLSCCFTDNNINLENFLIIFTSFRIPNFNIVAFSKQKNHLFCATLM